MRIRQVQQRQLKSVTVSDLAAEYGFTDLDGSQPDAWRYLIAS
jgi:hypothetical protein